VCDHELAALQKYAEKWEEERVSKRQPFPSRGELLRLQLPGSQQSEGHGIGREQSSAEEKRSM
jgi:hypothetical protein